MTLPHFLYDLKEGIQNLLEDAARGNLVEEVHAGLQLQHIYVAAHDGVYVAPVLVCEQSLAHLAQACTKQGMLPIGTRLIDAVQTVELGVVTVPQSLLLGEDVPYPVACLASVGDFRQGIGIGMNLCLYEALQVEGLSFARSTAKNLPECKTYTRKGRFYCI